MVHVRSVPDWTILAQDMVAVLQQALAMMPSDKSNSAADQDIQCRRCDIRLRLDWSLSKRYTRICWAPPERFHGAICNAIPVAIAFLSLGS